MKKSLLAVIGAIFLLFSAISVTALFQTIILNVPLDYYNTSAANINFNFTVINSSDTLSTCNLTINGVVNISNILATNGTPQINTTNGFNDGLYHWNVTCWNSSNNVNTPVTRKFSIDTVAPTTSLNGTSAKSLNAGQTVYIWANWADATTGVKNVELIVSGIVNKTNTTGLVAGSEVTYNFSYVTSISQIGSTLNFTINATDYAGNENSTALLQVAVVDGLSPNVILISPIDGHNSSNTNVTLQFNVTDNYASTIYCNITVDGVVNTTQNDTSITPNIYKTFTTLITSLLDSTHYWNVTCWDSSNNKNISATRKFSVDTVPPIISNLRNILTTNESSYIEFNCNENCNYLILWYNSNSLGVFINSNIFSTSHSAYLSTLLNSTTYFINLTVWDRVGNSVVNNTFKFTTKSSTPDTTPPTIELNDSLPSNITNNIDILLYANFSDPESGFVGNIILNELSDGSTAKNLTFSYNENQTVYLNISKNSNLAFATLKLKGALSYVDVEESASCTGPFFHDNTACEKHFDETWTGNSLVSPAFDSNVYIYENFKIFSNNATLIWNAFRTKCGSNTNLACYTYCWNGNEWDLIGTAEEVQFSSRVHDYPVTNRFAINPECLSEDTLQLKYHLYTSPAVHYGPCSGAQGCSSWEAAINWTGANSSLEVGTHDGNYEWKQSGNFDTATTSDFSNEINQYLTNCNADNFGYCYVPMIFNLPAGVIEISNINISYQGNNSCEICISSDGSCDTEWTVNNVTNSYSNDYLNGNCSYSWNASNYNDSIYNVSIRIKDAAYNTGISSKKITLDRTSPIFNYLYPYDNGAFTVNFTVNNTANTTYIPFKLTFWYRVNDLSSVTNCSLIFNNKINNTHTSLQKNNYYNYYDGRFDLNISTAISSTQYYNWSIICTDIFGHEGLTDIRKFTLIIMSNFSGETTDLGAVNLSKVENLTFEQVTSGKIRFSEIVNLSGILDINKHIKISYNKIEIDTSVVPILNKSATLYIYNLTYSNTPRVMRNNISCPDTICKIVNYSNGTLIFNVTQFSVYTTEDAPADSGSSGSGSSDGSSSSGGGGSGGGGGGGTAGFICNKDWQCDEWTDCIDGLQTRQCEFVKVPQHWQETPCPDESKQPVKSQTCEVKKETSAQTKSSGVREIKQEAIKPKETNQSKKEQITGMAVQQVPKPNKLIAFIGIAVLLALLVFFYFKFFRLKT